LRRFGFAAILRVEETSKGASNSTTLDMSFALIGVIRNEGNN
jgi:hypothetical protein